MNEDSWKKAFTFLKNLDAKKPSWTEDVQFKLIHHIIVTEKELNTILASNQMTTAYTVEKKIPLIIRS